MHQMKFGEYSVTIEIKDLKIKAATIIEQARSKLNEADVAGVTAERAKEINAEVDRMFADADVLEARASRMEEVEKRSAVYDAADARRSTDTREIRSDNKADQETRQADAMNAYLRGHEMTAEQRSAMVMEKRAGQSVGDATKGGYLVPSSLAAKISVSLANGRPMLDPSVVNLITTSNGQGLSVPVLANANQKGRRIAEGAAANRGELVFDRKDLTPYKYTSDFIPVTAELMADSGYDLESFISDAAGNLVGGIVNEELTTGSGTAMPWGIVPAAGTPAITSAGTGAIAADDLINLQHAVGVQYHANASFMFNQTVLGLIRKLKNSNGDYIWTQGLGGTPSTVLGQRYFVNPDMANVAANSVSVTFGDMSKFTVRQVGSPSIRRADELGLGTDETLFILFARYAGNLIDAAAVKSLKTKA